jgi:hypothetical protein
MRCWLAPVNYRVVLVAELWAWLLGDAEGLAGAAALGAGGV